MPTVSVNLDIDQYVQVNTGLNTGLNPLILQGHRDTVRITLSELKPAKANEVFHTLGGDDPVLHLNSIDTNVWALAQSDKSSLIVSETEPFPVKTLVTNGVPIEFTKITSNASTVQISKGNLNEIDFVPRIRNEHVGVFSNVQAVVNATTLVGQIFQASKDNISALVLAMESAAGVVIDDFESYTNDLELQAVWTSTLANLPLLETDTSFTGSKSMRLITDVNTEEWSRTSSPQDFTGYTGKFKSYFSNAFEQQKVSVFIEDNVANSKSFLLTQTAAATLCNCEVNEAAMIEDQATPTDIINIVKIGFRVVEKRVGSYVIIDDLVSVPPPGSIRVKLWDMGATLPTTGVTSIDDGTQYDQIGDARSTFFDIPLEGGKRIYHLEEFFAGVDKEFPDNKLITIDNYYIIQLEYVDTDINVYGPDTSLLTVPLYTNGYAFTAPDEATPITQIDPNSDLMFAIMSTQPIYFVGIGWRFDAEPNGNSSILVFLRDPNGFVTEVIIDHEESPEQSFTFNAESRPMFLDDGDKLQFLFNDDPTDQTRTISGEARFWYEPPIING
jgi:hypothetical protein